MGDLPQFQPAGGLQPDTDQLQVPHEQPEHLLLQAAIAGRLPGEMHQIDGPLTGGGAQCALACRGEGVVGK